MSDVCIKCGRRKRVIESLCLECFYEANPPILGINEFKIVTCPKCGSYLVKGKWTDDKIEDVTEEMLLASVKMNSLYDTEIKVKEVSFDKNSCQILFLLESTIKKRKFSQELIYTARLEKEVCSRCSKKASGYYEGVLQVRGKKDGLLAEIKAEIIKNQDSYDIKSMESTRFGFDIKFRSIRKVRKDINHFLERFGGNYTFSTQLFSKNKLTSKDVLRNNIRYNAPSFGKGEFVRTDEGYFKLTSVKNKIMAQDLFSGEKKALEIDPFKDRYEIIPPLKAQVIKVYPKLSVLHPITFEEAPIEGDIPRNVLSKLHVGDTLEVILANDKVFFVK